MARGLRGIKAKHPLGSVPSRSGVSELTAESGLTFGVKISALPAANTANGSDQLEVNQGGTTRRVTVGQIAALGASGNGPVNAASYGNDGAAILAAMAAAQSSGNRTVYIPDGIWNCSSEIVIPTDYPIRLIGQSRTGTILRATGGLARLMSFSSSSAALGTGGEILNMTIDCNLVANEGIRLWRAREWLLDSLLVYRVKNASVGTETDPSTNAGKAISLGGGSNTLGCRISNTSILYEEADYPDPSTCPAIGVYMAVSTASDNMITDMVIKNAKYACIYDNGNGGNQYHNIHPYGYPVGDSGLLDYRPQYGIYANTGYVNIVECYLDTMAVAGIYLAGQDNLVVNTRHTSSKATNTCSAIEFASAIQRTTIVGCMSGNMGGGRYKFDGTIGTSVRMVGNDTGDPLRVTTVANAVNWINVTAGATGNDATISAFGDASTGITYQTSGTGTHKLQWAGVNSLEVYGIASQVNYARVRGSIAGSPVVFSAEGSDASIGISHVPKGSGTHTFLVSGANSLEVYGVASQVNYHRMRGSIAGSPVVITPDGTDTNIDVQVAPKGTAYLRYGVLTASADAPVTGYIQIKDSGGTIRKLAVIT